MNRLLDGIKGCFASLLMFSGLATGGAIVDAEDRIDVGIRVTTQDDMVIAHLRFENRGTRPTLIMRGMNGIGYPSDPSRQTPGTTANQEFAIYCEGKRIDYIGKVAAWAPFLRHRFEVMAPGAVFDIRAVRLDNIYRLPEGSHSCTIAHSHYEFDEAREEAYAIGSRRFEFTYVKSPLAR